MTAHSERYGAAHRATRARWKPVVEAGRAVCWRCGLPIVSGTDWHLGHSDDGSRWNGPEHALCNTRDGGRKRAADLYGRRPRAPRPPVVSRWSQHWLGGFDMRCPACRAAGGPCPDAAPDVQPSGAGR